MIPETNGQKLQAGTATNKPKRIRGVIRRRKWQAADGTVRTAWQADFGVVNTKRLMKSFANREDAENWLRSQTILDGNQGAAGFTLTDKQRLDAVKAIALLDGLGVTLDDAARYYKQHKAPTIRKTITEVVTEYEADAEERNLRPTSIRSLGVHLAPLVAKYGTRLVSEFTRRDADAWIKSFPLSVSSKTHYRRIAHGMFNYAVDCEYVADNPFASRGRRRKYHEDESMPKCMSWRNVEKIMQTAAEHEPTMVPALAIGFFAGLRTSEVCQLDWKDIDLRSRKITVIPEVAKKRRARHVDIEDNLLQWLLPRQQAAGPVAPDGQKWRSRLDHIRELTKVKWPHNAMRHSYASHHLIKHGDAAKTAFQLGHGRDVSMLFEHYRSLIKTEEAEMYWQIRPVARDNALPFAKVI